MTDLKPCPFCGGGAEFSTGKTGTGGDWHYIECSECEAMGPHVKYADHNIAVKEALAEAWNTRAGEAMTDEELIARLRVNYLVWRWDEYVESMGSVMGEVEHMAQQMRDRIEALTEQLAAARDDAKEAEAYAEELEKELDTCRRAQAVMDNTVADLDAKLAGGVIAEYDDDSTVFLSGYAGGAAIGGAWSTLTLMEKASDGTLRVREYKAQGDWRATLVEIKGESRDGQ